jgi:hypothetical protein
MSRFRSQKTHFGRAVLDRTTIHVDVAQCIRQLGVAAALALAAWQTPHVLEHAMSAISSMNGLSVNLGSEKAVPSAGERQLTRAAPP